MLNESTHDIRRHSWSVLGRPFDVGQCLVLCTILCCLIPRFATGSNGGQGRMPLGNAKSECGLAVDIDTRWVGRAGYRPVRVKVSSLRGPLKEDRLITVQVRPRSWGGSTTVSQTIEIPAGSTSETVTMSMPWCDMEPWWLEIKVSEEGRLLRDLCPQGGLNMSTMPWNQLANGKSVPAILLIDSDALTVRKATGRRRSGAKNAKSNQAEPNTLPDIRRFLWWMPLLDNGSSVIDMESESVTDFELSQFLNDAPFLHMVAPQEVPRRWIDMTAIDLVVISFNDLNALVQNHVEQWKAVRSWVEAGGNLLVYGVDDESPRMKTLDNWIGMSADGPDDAERGAWRKPDIKNYRKAKSGFTGTGLPGHDQYAYGNMGPMGGNVFVAETATDPKDEDNDGKAETDPDEPNPSPFLFRDVGFGLVVAIGGENPFPGREVDWKWMFLSLGENRWKWSRRNGLSMSSNNPDYWDLLIPGIGSTPVVGFLTLITVSLILVGPCNYFLLRKWRRLHLLMITVPVGAGVITLAIVAYAILADGLGVKLRVRSYTALDQDAGRAASWSRQTYYASLVPSEGLWFPEDAAVYCVEESLSEYRDNVQFGNLHWAGNRQHLQTNFLKPRVAKQFLAIQSGKSSARLNFTVEDGDSLNGRVSNQLGTDVVQLLVWDADGRTSWATEIGAGEDAELQPIELVEANSRLAEIFAVNQPAYPEGFDPALHRGFDSFFWPSFVGLFPGNRGESVSFRSSLMEKRLSMARDSTHWRLHRGYLAIVQSSADVPVGIESARQVGSFQVIEGRW